MLNIKSMTVLYDSDCAFCCRSRIWILSQIHRLPIQFIPINSDLLKERFPKLPAGHLDELVVITDSGNIYYKEKAFVMCLYALAEYYEWSFKLAQPAFLPLVRNAYKVISKYRNVFAPKSISRNDKYLQTTLESYDTPDKCEISF